MAKHLQRELEKIKKSILSLGALVEDRVRLAIKSIETRNAEIADHATNIAEGVIYLSDGEIVRHGNF
jgi:phosphate transport system protein